MAKPLRVFPGEKVGLYVHSSGPVPDTDPNDHVTRFRDPLWVWNGRGGGTPDSIVYNNQRHAVTMENAHLRVMPGIHRVVRFPCSLRAMTMEDAILIPRKRKASPTNIINLLFLFIVAQALPTRP